MKHCITAVLVTIAISSMLSAAGSQELVQRGAALFEQKGCVGCHFTDSTARKVGPGLQGLFQREKLPASGKPVTDENIRGQLHDPFQRMPSFDLTEEEMRGLLAYLKTL